MLLPKTSHPAKFRPDRSNQLGEKRYLFGPSRRFFVTDGQKPDYLSRVSQRARVATKKVAKITDVLKTFLLGLWNGFALVGVSSLTLLRTRRVKTDA